MHDSARKAVAEFAVAVLAVAGAALFRFILDPILGDHLPFITFFIAVVVASWYGGLWSGLAAAVLGFIPAWYFFVPPRFTFDTATGPHLVGMVLYFVVSIAIASFGEAMHLAQRRSRRNQRTAHEQSQWLQTTLASVGDAVIATDAQGHVRFLNSVAQSLTGWFQAEALGRPLQDVFNVIDEQTRQIVEAPVAMAIREEATLGLVNHTILITWDGAERVVDASAAPIRDIRGNIQGVVLVFRDVTEKRRAELRRIARLAVTQTLAEADSVAEAAPRFLQSMCESLGWDMGAFWQLDQEARLLRCVEVWHRPGLAVTEFEEATRQRTFEPGIGLPGRVWADGKAVWIPDVVQDDNFPRAAIADREGLHGAFGFPILLGSEFRGVIEFFSHQIREPDADLLEMTATISGQIGQFMERRRAEAFLRDSERSLKEADRRKDEFLATLAHELRNPLAPIRNALEIIRLAGDDEATLVEARAMMERQVAQMVHLVDDLLDVSRITRGKLALRRQRLALATVVNSAVETAGPLIEAAGHELSVTLPPEPLLLEADPVRLAQVFANLLNNAAKFTDRGGRIRLTAERQGSDVVVSVGDNGIGIPVDRLPYVFEMFSQAAPALERSQGGLGIGLALVKGLVGMHGGSVEARSDGPGKGSEIIVRLPLADCGAGVAEPPARPPSPIRTTPSRRILVVDDLADTADSLALMLRLRGHEVRTAQDGLEALQAAEGFRPEVVLLDIGLPGLNGYEVARRIREQPWGREILLVAVTGWGQEEDKRRAAEAGFDHHLTKPVDPATLEKLLASVCLPPLSPASGERGRG